MMMMMMMEKADVERITAFEMAAYRRLLLCKGKDVVGGQRDGGPTI